MRDRRGPEHPPALSSSCAADLVGLFEGLHAGRVGRPAVSRRVLRWLAAGVDHSQVARTLLLDPLAHADGASGTRLWSKTGTDDGVRGEAGVAVRGERAVAFAALCAWDPGDPSVSLREVHARLEAVGEVVRAALEEGPGRH